MMSAHLDRTTALPVIVVIAAALVLSGCFGSRSRPAPIAAAPSEPVRTASLPPPAEQPTAEAPVAEEPLPGEGEPTQTASLPSEQQALAIGRADLIGGWAIASGGETCQLFMSLTTWTGGYRASTRGCSTPTLSTISAWDLNGKTVTLKGGEGASTVATLLATDKQQFNGTTAQGAAITVSR
ncbi:MAG: AprI/Inh family metalloprotease inhibitor [Pseudomonadota bacterium]